MFVFEFGAVGCAEANIDSVAIVVHHFPVDDEVKITPWCLVSGHIPETLGAHVVGEAVNVAKIIG